MRKALVGLKWLYPGMRVKRWIATVFAGAALIALGCVLALSPTAGQLQEALALAGHAVRRSLEPSATHSVGLLCVAAGSLIILIALRQLVASITSLLVPENPEQLADVVYHRRWLDYGERIVVIGGGTGLSTILRGLKRYTSNLTAIVTVTDDGGSSGRLVRDFNILPPGDIRNCLVALADAEPLMTQILQYRFDCESTDLHGHSLGNLLLTAMTQITGDFDQAVRATSRVLAIRGRVLPSTLEQVTLQADLEDGRVIDGEVAISREAQSSPIRRLRLVPESPKALAEAVEAIRDASAIIIGPGSLYTSVIPNLLAPELRDALHQATAHRIYICNVMTQPGESQGMTACDHVRVLANHIGRRAFDYVLVNVQRPSEEVLARYAQEGAEWVKPDVEEIRRLGYRVVTGNFMSQSSVVRHDAEAISKALLKLL